MTTSFNHDVVRMMGVKALAVYVLVMIAEAEGLVPVSRNWLVEHMPAGTSPGSVTTACDWLASPERQFITKISAKGGWRLASAAQLPLPAGQFEDPIYPLSGQMGINNNDVSLESALPSNLSLISLTGGDLSAQRTLPKPALSPDDLDRVAAFKAAGIGRNKWGELLSCEWVTVEYIQAHKAWVDRETWEYPVGMMITRMLNEQSAPAVALPTPAWKANSRQMRDKSVEVVKFAFDVEQVIADFMDHPKGCSCGECGFILAMQGDTSLTCSVCKHHNCECSDG